jgi:hypothetical protein
MSVGVMLSWRTCTVLSVCRDAKDTDLRVYVFAAAVVRIMVSKHSAACAAGVLGSLATRRRTSAKHQQQQIASSHAFVFTSLHLHRTSIQLKEVPPRILPHCITRLIAFL